MQGRIGYSNMENMIAYINHVKFKNLRGRKGV